MNIRSLIVAFVAIFTLVGCSVEKSPLSLLSHKKTISIKDINEKFTKSFPINKKPSFGFVSFKKAMIKASDKDDSVAISVAFRLTSFEIPEGIDGAMILSGGLRYDAKSKKILLKDVTPRNIRYSDASLAEYVSKEVSSTLNVLIMRELTDIEVYKIDGISSGFIRKVKIEKGNIFVEYGV